MENDLSRVVDALPGLVWTALPDGQFDFLNQRWCEHSGLRADEGHGQGWNASEAISSVDDRPRPLLIKTERDDGSCVRLTVQVTGNS